MIKFNFIYFFSILFCLIDFFKGPKLHAQVVLRETPKKILITEELGVDKGLSQGMIHGMAFDQKGYLWVGTKDGLNRYDGTGFRVFRNDPFDTTSITSNYIRSLHIDLNGLLWVGTIASGYELYDPHTSSFIHFGKEIKESINSSIESVYSIHSDLNGRVLIWGGSGEEAELVSLIPGKNVYERASWKLETLSDVFYMDPNYPKPNGINIIGFYDDGALLYADKHTLYWMYSDRIDQYKPETTGKGIIKYFIRNDDLYYFDGVKSIIFKWDPAIKDFVALYQFPSNKYIQLKELWIDNQNRIWCSLRNEEFVRIDPEKGEFTELSLDFENKIRAKNIEYSVYSEDQNSNIWIGTTGWGLCKISSRNDQFHRLDSSFSNLTNIIIARNNRKYNIIKAPSEEAYIKRDEYLEKRGFVVASNYAKDPSEDLIWFMAFSKESNKLALVNHNYTSNSLTHFPVDICFNNPSDAFASIMFDSTGVLWVVSECEAKNVQLKAIHVPNLVTKVYWFPVNAIQSEHVFLSDWYIDKKGGFWFGTKQGLFYFNPSSSNWKHWHSDITKANSLSQDYVLTICPDPKYPEKYLWIGTDGGGLNKMDIKKETFLHYTTEDGLTNNVIYGVLPDRHQNLWFSTNRGLNLFQPESGMIRSFGKQDGLPSIEFNRFDYGNWSDSILFFSGVKGPVSFNPEVFYGSTTASELVINGLWISNQEVLYSEGKRVVSNQFSLPAPIEYCKQISFPYFARMIKLEFALLDFTNPYGNKYRYKLEGFNKDWILAGTDNQAVFTNLNPGNYTFLVSGLNSQNVWSEPTRLEINIKPPWWRTWWFRASVVMCIIAVGYLFYRYRLGQALKLQHLRNRIAADLHDEIGSTLSSISLAGTVIENRLKSGDEEVKGLINRINHNTQSMMEAMSDIVWTVNAKNDRFDQVLYRMREFALEILEPGDVSVQFNVQHGITTLHLNMEQRKNLYLVFKEIVTNVSKYANCKTVLVELDYLNGKLRMKISDDGVGFDVNSSDIQGARFSGVIGGNGIQNMFNRTTELKGKLEVNSKMGEGTEIILSFPV